MKKVISFVLIMLSILFSYGCVSIGRQFETQNVVAIQKGVTTMEDINNLFGPPYRKGVEDGDLTWTYLWYRIKLLGDKNTRDLYIKFDSNKIVKSWTYNTNFPDETLNNNILQLNKN